MSDKHINDGGPAFPGQWYDFQPCTGDQVVREQWSGMSLRDYFAAKAMQGLLAAQALRDYFAAKAMQGLLAAQVHGFNDRPAKGPFASMAYEMADAMLKAREGER